MRPTLPAERRQHQHHKGAVMADTTEDVRSRKRAGRRAEGIPTARVEMGGGRGHGRGPRRGRSGRGDGTGGHPAAADRRRGADPTGRVHRRRRAADPQQAGRPRDGRLQLPPSLADRGGQDHRAARGAVPVAHPSRAGDRQHRPGRAHLRHGPRLRRPAVSRGDCLRGSRPRHGPHGREPNQRGDGAAGDVLRGAGRRVP